jgi:lipid A 3-O-deacylase
MTATIMACVMWTQRADAVDGVAIEYGETIDAATEMVRAALQWTWSRRWREHTDWRGGGYWDVAIGYWNNNENMKTNSGLWEVAVTPVFRIERIAPGRVVPYFEAGVGAHLISQTSEAPDRRFSTAFQFGSHVGGGVRFGPRYAFDAGLRYQHISNANIQLPNNGVNCVQLRVGYWF